MDSAIVPSSIQRIRSFLVEMCGMKVKPWASAEDTLAALHATLVARQGCDVFWTSLRVLLETLARDMAARQQAVPGALVDNEILSPESYAALLGEIRACLAKQPSQPVSSFRGLAQALSTPALALLLLLGGVTTVGCRTSLGPPNPPDAAVADAGLPQPDRPRAETRALAPDRPSDPTPDNTMVFILPDLPPAKADVHEAASSGPNDAKVTIEDIMNSCNVPSAEQSNVMACLGYLGEAWTEGLAAYLAGKDCNAIFAALNCQTWNMCSQQASPSNFDPGALPLCQPVLVYLGVRFV